jgi:hypothetical protein
MCGFDTPVAMCSSDAPIATRGVQAVIACAYWAVAWCGGHADLVRPRWAVARCGVLAIIACCFFASLDAITDSAIDWIGSAPCARCDCFIFVSC